MTDLLALVPAQRVPSPLSSLTLDEVDELELDDTHDPSFPTTRPSLSQTTIFNKRSHSTIESTTDSILESSVKRLRCQANMDPHDIKPLPRLWNFIPPAASNPPDESQTLGSQVQTQNSLRSRHLHTQASSTSPPSTSTTFADSQIRTLTELILKLTGDVNKRLNRADRQTEDVHSVLSRIEGNISRLEDKLDDVSSWVDTVRDEVRGELEQAVGPLEERLGGLVSGIKVTVEEQISTMRGDIAQLRDGVQNGMKGGDLVEFREGVEKGIKRDLAEFGASVKRGFKKDLIELKDRIERGRMKDLLSLRGDFEQAMKRDHVELTAGVEKSIKRDLVRLKNGIDKGFKKDLVELREGVEKGIRRDLVELRNEVNLDARQLREDTYGRLGRGGVQKHHIANKETGQAEILPTKSRRTMKENMTEFRSRSSTSSQPSSSRRVREASDDVEAEAIHRPQDIAEHLDTSVEMDNMPARLVDADAFSIPLASADGCVENDRDALEQEMEDEDTVTQEVEASLMEFGDDDEDGSEHNELQKAGVEHHSNRLLSSRASPVSPVSAEDDHAKEVPSDSTGTPSHRRSCRPRKSVDYRFHPLNGLKARLVKPKPAKIRKRAFNGKAMFATKCLKPSDGSARGYGIWPPKMAHTKKGREQDITCDVCKGQVHWMCAGFKNDDPAPIGEWHCPDCREQIRRGVPPKTIEVAPQYRCIRGNCVLRDKQRVERVEGDEEEYVVELIAGRRAISRNEDKSRNFEYLVKWWGYGYDDMTWEPLSNLEHHSGEIDDFVKEAAKLELPLHKRVTLLPESRKYWDEYGEERE